MSSSSSSSLFNKKLSKRNLYNISNRREIARAEREKSRNKKTTFDFVEATFDFVAKNGYDVERICRKISSFRQSRNKLNMFNLFRLCRKNRSTCRIRQCCFDIVAGVGGALVNCKHPATTWLGGHGLWIDRPFSHNRQHCRLLFKYMYACTRHMICATCKLQRTVS